MVCRVESFRMGASETSLDEEGGVLPASVASSIDIMLLLSIMSVPTQSQ